MKLYFSSIIAFLIIVGIGLTVLNVSGYLSYGTVIAVLVTGIVYPILILFLVKLDLIKQVKRIQNEFPNERIMISTSGYIYMDYEEIHLVFTDKQVHIFSQPKNNALKSYPYHEILDFDAYDFITLYIAESEKPINFVSSKQSQINDLLNEKIIKKPVIRFIKKEL